ncbi:glycosyltransferase family A protein [Shewanella sp. NIFS-20-20]|uniref:glycosyltransferase family 2 protein n=1 Tax=Shewanella sp. NIFS-20-20 TaxID=2853806 RepID=UPI001C440A21|nr:glycosyltransferase family A protein [Shewanella sp. NIFS-20-20]MBV7314833.1 glycosyltransferase family 2 protein [Shewanella sp. NIFS-20-20]
MKPRFSIIIPLYNKKGLISKTIDSVLSQTYTNFEIIVIDDGSTDGSLESISGLNDERLKLFKKENGGVSSARNFGINKAQGQYVAFLDADDKYEFSFLENVSSAIDKFSSADAICTAFFRVNDNIKMPSYIPDIESGSPFIVTDFYRTWASDSFFCASSIVVRREYFYSHQKWFPEGESLGEDQEVWFHIADNGQFVYIPKLLSNYTIGIVDSLSSSSNLNLDELPFVTRLKQRSLNEGINSPKWYFIFKYNLERAILNALNGQKIEAIKIFRSSRFYLSFMKYQILLFLLLLTPSWLVALVRKLRRGCR